MQLLFWLMPVFFLTLNPVTWSKYMGKTREKGGFILVQVGRLIIGTVIAMFINYFLLPDKTLYAFFSHTALFIGVLAIADTIGWSEHKFDFSKILTGIVGLGLVLGILFMTFIYPSTIYQDLYSMVDANIIDDNFEAMDIESIVVVPLEFAKYKGDKLLGQLENYSYYTIGSYSKQKIKGELFWVAPIRFSSYFTYKKAGFTPGYIMVSAEDETKSAQVVTGYEMKYVPSAYFGNNLYRMIRRNYPDIIIKETSFEPDDTGKPYYVVTYGSYKKYRYGNVVEGIVLVDPVSGEMKKYATKEIPDFIDQTFPEHVASIYNKYFGEFKLGFLNRFFTKKDIHTPTVWGAGEEVVGVFGPDKNMYWFTDHTTPHGSSSSMVGYSLINARTGEFKYYTGARGFLNGHAAVEVVNKSFQKDNWVGTQPLLYNIYGQETWVVPIIDGNGLLRRIALVHAESGGIVHETNKRELFDRYKLMLATNQIQGNTVPTNISNVKEVEGRVLRVSTVSSAQGTTLRLLLSESDKIFNVDVNTIPYAVFTKENDIVRIKYIDNEEITVTVREFKNITIDK